MDDRDDAPRTPLLDAFRGQALLPLSDAAKLMRGRRGKPPCVQSVRRWADPRRGYRAVPHGEALVLQTIVVSRERRTTAEWVQSFEEARLRMGARAAAGDGPRPPTGRQQAAAFKLAGKNLREQGFEHARDD